jgi:hypothetical protein
MNKESGIFYIGFFIFLFPLITVNQFVDYEFVDQSKLTIGDRYLEVIIDVEGGNIKEAVHEDNPIIIDPNDGVNIRLHYSALNISGVDIDRQKTVFLFADLDVLSQSDKLDFTLNPDDNFTYVQTWKFKNFIGNENIELISGTYKVRYDLYYSVSNENRILRGTPFYVKFSGNPLTSVPSVMTTIAVVSSGVSLIGLANAMRSSTTQEVGKSIEATKVSPTKKLIGYYKGSTYSRIQAEVSKSAYAYAIKLLRGGKCPQCNSEWPENQDKCLDCQITFEEAVELYSKTLSEKSLNVAKEVVDSVSGLSLSSIARSLGEGIVPTTSIISVLTFSGLTLVQPRLAKSWQDKTRKLVFRGLRIAIYSLFWIQATGIDTLSITTLVIVILSGFILPTIFSTILGFNIKEKVQNFWASNQLSTSSVAPDAGA